jgi:viroplasmin and RNaseH domain-containing protein
MAKKFYAVKVGRKTGVYETWAECQIQISGFSGAVYKGFSTREEAVAFIGNVEMKSECLETTPAIAYVDGSYDSLTNSFSYGMVFFIDGRELHFLEKFSESEMSEMNNVAGEIKGAEAAIQYCLDHDIPRVTIYHDYEGIARWCTGEWKAKKEGTMAYAEFCKKASSKVCIQFVKVKGHSGDKNNDLADRLAKIALGIEIAEDNIIITEDKHLAKNKGVYVNRDEIVNLIREVGTKQWENFSASELTTAGTAQRCVMTADGKNAMLNLYFNNNGTTTITPTGSNLEISSVVKALIEEKCTFSGGTQGKTYSIKKLPLEWSEKIIDYLKSLEGVATEEISVKTVPEHDSYVFTSKIGDKLTVKLYKTGTLTLQGKPAYLYGEAISFLSYCNDISVDDIVDSINTFHNVSVKTTEVRNDMEVLMPRAYGNIDEMILKLLSPSISLRKVSIELDDYSCYAFPALRALEGYIKYLLGLKGVTVGNNFGGVFSGTTLCLSAATKVNDADYQNELERLFAYFKGNRHVLFHTQQILVGTKLIEDKQEADEIINTVINLIETSYANINK